MKKSFNTGAWSGVFKKIAIATFAFAVLFMLNATAVYASETNTAAQEQIRSGGRVSTEREEHILLPSGIRESRIELKILRFGNRNRTEREERILLPSGIRERMDELEFERSGTRGRTELESRGIRNGLRNAS